MKRKPNIVLGVVLGLAMALGLSAVALLIYQVRGAGTFERLGTSLGETLVIYLAGGAVGGAIFGSLLPLTSYRWGASVVGVLAAVPVYLGAAFTLEANLSAGLIPAVFVGAVVGYVLWLPIDGADSEQQVK